MDYEKDWKEESNPSGVDFTNILRAAFFARTFQKHKKTLMTRLSFCTLGSALVKAAHKMLVKSTPDDRKSTF